MNSFAAMLAQEHGNQEPKRTSAAARLPAETLADIFMHVDPHTLYTSVRCLSRSWKHCVEERLLANEFHSGQWRVGLRVTRKPKAGKVWHGGVAGRQGTEAPGARWQHALARLEEEMSDAPEQEREAARAALQTQYADDVLSRPGALEDELSPLEQADVAASNQPLVHIVPLHFERYDAESTTLRFATNTTAWHALFEHNHGDGSSDASTGRLDLDFGIVWRFPGDGQDEDGWGVPDQENGWLSRFYCSSFDVKDAETCEEKESYGTLHSSPLARRIRRAVYNRPDVHAPELADEQTSTAWSDDGHEYMSLSLALGTEFFVRRSARANYLLRRLEVEALADEERERRGNEWRQSMKVPAISTCGTPVIPSARKKTLGRLGVSCSTSASSVATSGTSTPLPPWSQARGRSFADVASTPPCTSSYGRARSSCTSPTPFVGAAARASGRGSSRPYLSRRTTGHLAPQSSAVASGFTSVLHHAPIDGKAAEEEHRKAAKEGEGAFSPPEVAASDDDDTASCVSSTPSSPSVSSPRTGHCPSKTGVTGQLSVPRAHFCARLMRPAGDGVKPWTGGDAWGRGASAAFSQSTAFPISTWEWSR